MLNNPKIIIADEPTGNLDPATSENIMGLLLDINRSGTTVIVCTHDANMVDRMKKRVIEIEDGLVVRDKEDSAYSDEINDASAASDYEEDSFAQEKPPVGDFYFGETPASVASANAAAAAAAKAAAQTTPLPIAATAFGDEDGYDDEEVAFGDVLTDVSALPVENDVEPVEEAPAETAPVEESKSEEVSEAPAQESTEEPKEEPAEETSVEEVPVEEIPIEELPVVEELKFGQDEPVISETSVVTSSDETVEEDDSWLNEVRMDDIDLDIQEDDE